MTTSRSEATLTSSYEVAHLTAHLEAAGDFERLHSLLTKEKNGTTNVWHAIKESEDDIEGYLDDLARALRHALLVEQDGSRSVALSHQCRYTLMRASIHSREGNIAPEVVARLAVSGRWNMRKALTHLRASTDSRDQIDSICRLIPGLPRKVQEQLFDQGVLEIRNLQWQVPFPEQYQEERASQLCKLFGALSTPKPPRALALLFLEAEAQTLPRPVQWIVDALVPHVDEAGVPRLMRLLEKSIQRPASPPLIDRFFDRIALLGHRLTLLARLSKRLPELERSVQAADIVAQAQRLFESTQGMARLHILGCLYELRDRPVPGFTAVMNLLVEHVFATAKQEGRELTSPPIQLAANILPLCSTEHQRQLAAHVFASVRSWSAGNNELDQLVDAIALWPESFRAGLFEAAAKQPYRFERFSALVSIARVLPDCDHKRAVDLIEQYLTREGWDIANTAYPARVAALCNEMSEQGKGIIRAGIRKGKDPKPQMEALAAYYIASADAAERSGVLQEALQIAFRDHMELHHESPLRLFLGKVADSLTPDDAESMVLAARRVGDEIGFLYAIAIPLAFLEESKRAATLDWALDVARDMEAVALARWFPYIAPFIPPACHSKARALVAAVDESGPRAVAVSALLKMSGLRVEERATSYREALLAVDGAQYNRDGMRALAMIAQSVTDPQLTAELACKARDLLDREDYPTLRAEMLADAAGLFPPEELVSRCRDTLAAAEARKEISFRDSLILLAPWLPIDMIAEIRGKILNNDYTDFSDARVAVSRRLMDLGRPAQAFDLVTRLSEGLLAQTLQEVADVLPLAETAAAVELAQGIKHHFAERALAALAVRLAVHGKVPSALALIERIEDPEWLISGASGVAVIIGEPECSRLLARIVGRLKELTTPLQTNAMSQISPALALCAPRPRWDLLIQLLELASHNPRAALVPQIYHLAPVFNAIAGPPAVEALMRSVRQVARWWP